MQRFLDQTMEIPPYSDRAMTSVPRKTAIALACVLLGATIGNSSDEQLRVRAPLRVRVPADSGVSLQCVVENPGTYTLVAESRTYDLGLRLWNVRADGAPLEVTTDETGPGRLVFKATDSMNLRLDLVPQDGVDWISTARVSLEPGRTPPPAWRETPFTRLTHWANLVERLYGRERPLELAWALTEMSDAAEEVESTCRLMQTPRECRAALVVWFNASLAETDSRPRAVRKVYLRETSDARRWATAGYSLARETYRRHLGPTHPFLETLPH
jgi:hypothetical protein